MSAAPIDYASLAKEHGGSEAIDYGALAAQHGGAESAAAPVAPIETATISARKGGAREWLGDLENDIRSGTTLTGPGRILHAMGAKGIDVGSTPGAGDTLMSPILGPTHAAQGIAESVDHPIAGPLKALGGALETFTLPAAFVAPEAGEAVSGKLATAAQNLNPSAMKEAAGGLLQSVAHDANKLPVNLQNSGDAALRLMQWQKSTNLGPTLNKFLNRITNPKLGQITYEEARDFYQILGDMSANEKMNLAKPIKRDVVELLSGLKNDIGDTADQAGKAAEYYKGLKDYSKAARLQEWYDTAKELGIGALKYGIPTGVAGYGIKKGIDLATQK